MRLDWIFLPRQNACAKFYIIIIMNLHRDMGKLEANETNVVENTRLKCLFGKSRMSRKIRNKEPYPAKMRNRKGTTHLRKTTKIRNLK